jgi:hypothetical protein
MELSAVADDGRATISFAEARKRVQNSVEASGIALMSLWLGRSRVPPPPPPPLLLRMGGFPLSLCSVSLRSGIAICRVGFRVKRRRLCLQSPSVQR